MNNARLAIGFAALLIIASAAAVIVSDDQADASYVGDHFTATYNSENGGLELSFDDTVPTGFYVIVNLASDGVAWNGNVGSDGNADWSAASSVSGSGDKLFSLRVVDDITGAPEITEEFTLVIVSIDFDGGDNHGGNSVLSTVYLSTGYEGYILPDSEDCNWTMDGESVVGWSLDGTIYPAGSVLPADVISSDMILEAVYGDAPIATEVTITVIGNGADVVADGLVDGKITAEVGDKLTFTVNAQTGYTLDGATYTYNGQTIDITEGSFTITVAEGADMLVVDAEKEQPVEPVTVTVRSTGAQITYDGETVAGSVQLMPGSEATFGISALEGYTMEGCSVTYGGQPVAVDNGQFTITVYDEGGVIEIVLQQVGPGPGPEPDVYDVTVISNDGAMGTASAKPASAEEGTTVTLSYIANDGYWFVEWISDDVEITGDSFVMPAKDVTVTAVFEAIPPTEYTITVNQATGGTATASAATAIEGVVITLTATPDDGYVLDHWVINGDDVYRNTFTMPAGNVTVTPVFRALENYDVTIEISGEGTVLNGGSEVMDGTVITIRELSDLVLTYTAGEDNYTVRCTVSDENARVSNASGTLTVSGISTDCTVTIEFVQGYMVSVNGGDHGEVSPGTGLQAENATVTYTVRPDAGYAVNRVLVDGQEVVVTGNQFQVDVGSSTHSIIVEYVFVGIVDDDDEEYVPPVVVVPKGDDDTTTYIVAIAAAAVVAVLAAIILMQSRKS